MILEIVTWKIKPGQEREFENGFRQAQRYLANAAGYCSHQLQRCIEEPGKYLLLVNWEKLEDHTEGFRQSSEYLEYRALISPYYEPGATMEHYAPVQQEKS